MNKINLTLGIALIALVLAGSSLFKSEPVPEVKNSYGAATTDCGQTTCLTGGLRLLSGDFSVVSAAGATTTAQVGCVQTIATSSATSIKLSFNSSATTTSINGGVIQGVVLWQYGTCP